MQLPSLRWPRRLHELSLWLDGKAFEVAKSPQAHHCGDKRRWQSNAFHSLQAACQHVDRNYCQEVIHTTKGMRKALHEAGVCTGMSEYTRLVRS